MDKWGEDSCQALLDTFCCPLNLDVEHFVKTQAINFAKQMVTITHLIIYNDDSGQCLLGYYALANKFVNVGQEHLSNTIIKKISKFARYDKDTQCYQVAMPLIAQLGKNFAPDLPYAISGRELLDLALDRVIEAERILGGKTVYLECNGEPKLRDFYSKSDFQVFGTRPSTTDNGETLVQMIKYF